MDPLRSIKFPNDLSIHECEYQNTTSGIEIESQLRRTKESKAMDPLRSIK